VGGAGRCPKFEGAAGFGTGRTELSWSTKQPPRHSASLEATQNVTSSAFSNKIARLPSLREN